MTHLLLLFLATLGFALLCISRARHQRDMIGRKLGEGTANFARWCGLSVLGLAYLLAGYRFGWATGTLEWLGLSSIGAVLTMTMLSHRSGQNSSPR